MLEETLDLNDDIQLEYYSGTRFENNKKYGSINLTQTKMNEMILELVGINYTSKDVKINNTPSCISEILDNDPNDNHRVQKWN